MTRYCRVIQQQFQMTEYDIYGVKIYSDPSYIFSGSQDRPQTPGSTPLLTGETVRPCGALINYNHRRRSREAEGAVAPQLQTRGKRYQMPPLFRRLSGMMPASTEKHREYRLK